MTGGGTTAITVCAAEEEATWVKHANVIATVGSVIVSIAAAVVAYKALQFSQRQDGMARSRSIRDDYWLRTVVSPVSIEPFQQYIVELRNALPPQPNAATALTRTELNAFYKSAQGKLNEIALGFNSLALIDGSLAAAVGAELEELEEDLSNYVGELGRHLDGGLPTAPSRAQTSQTLTSRMVKLFTLIQEHQTRLG